MHAMRRISPAERARHVGHVQAFPILATNSTSSSTHPPTVTLPTPSSATTTHSSAPSAVATTSSTTSSPASSTPLQSLSTTLLTPSTTLSPTSLTSPSTSPPPSNASAVSHSTLSSGAIAGIIAGAVVVGAVLIMFLVRKTALRRRERRRVSWSGAPGVGSGLFDEPKPSPGTTDPLVPLSTTPKPQWVPPPSPFEPHGQPIYSTSVTTLAPMHPAACPTPPPATYNNPTTYPGYPVPMTYGPRNAAPLAMTRVATPSTLSPARAQQGPLEAIVKCTFVPTLPDELSITTGDRVFVIEEYDDGWNLCTNVRGERGMVPRECLEHAPIDQSAIDWRNAGRSSSLGPGGNTY